MLPSARDMGRWHGMQPSAFVLDKDREGFPGSCQAPKAFSPFSSSPAAAGMGQGVRAGLPPCPIL